MKVRHLSPGIFRLEGAEGSSHSCPCSRSRLIQQVAQVFHGSRAWHAAFSLLRHGPIPAIAALHGATIGGGPELAAACHIRVADETAQGSPVLLVVAETDPCG